MAVNYGISLVIVCELFSTVFVIGLKNGAVWSRMS